MFIGFIAVIVILLIIVAVMSTGVTTGSGGVDQTKAAKVVTELGTLAQSIGFYKTITTNSDYEGVSVDELSNAGIVASEDIVDVVTLNNVKDDAGNDITTGNIITSKAIKGLYYDVTPATNSVNYVKIKALVDTDDVETGSTLAQALEKAYTKFGEGADDADENGVKVGAINTAETGDAADGAQDIIFK